MPKVQSDRNQVNVDKGASKAPGTCTSPSSVEKEILNTEDACSNTNTDSSTRVDSDKNQNTTSNKKCDYVVPGVDASKSHGSSRKQANKKSKKDDVDVVKSDTTRSRKNNRKRQATSDLSTEPEGAAGNDNQRYKEEKGKKKKSNFASFTNSNGKHGETRPRNSKEEAPEADKKSGSSTTVPTESTPAITLDKLDHLSLSEENIDRKNKKVRKNRPISSAHADVVGKTEAEEEKDERRVPPHEEGLRGAEDGSSESRNINISVDKAPSSSLDSADWESRLFVQGPADLLTEEFIQENFSEYGQLEYVKLLYKAGKPKGMAFVKYTTVAGASNAVKTVNENEDMVGSVPLKVSIAEPQKGKRQKRRRDNNTLQNDQNNNQKRSSSARKKNQASQPNDRDHSGVGNSGSRKTRFKSNETSSINSTNFNQHDVRNEAFLHQQRHQHQYPQIFSHPTGFHNFPNHHQQIGIMQQGFIPTPSLVYYNPVYEDQVNHNRQFPAAATGMEWQSYNAPMYYHHQVQAAQHTAGFATGMRPGQRNAFNVVVQSSPNTNPQIPNIPNNGTAVNHQLETRDLNNTKEAISQRTTIQAGLSQRSEVSSSPNANNVDSNRVDDRGGKNGAYSDVNGKSEGDSKMNLKTIRNEQKNGLQLLREKLEHFDDETSMSLLHIMPRFEEENIDFQVFLALTEDDMKELGLKMGDRKRISMAQTYFLSSQYSGDGVNANAVSPIAHSSIV